MKVIEEPKLAAEVKRKLPWFVDVFLYPISVSGIIHIVIFLVVPFLIGLISRLILSWFWPVGGLISLLLYLLYVGYVFFYLRYCIFDSSKGGLRAPDITAQPTPDRWELVSEVFLILGSLAICFCPLALYYFFTVRVGLTFWLLFAFGSFFFPMALLAAVLFESFDALNPLSIIRSICKTFLPYCTLVPLFIVLNALIIRIIANLPETKHWIQAVDYGSTVIQYLCSKSFIYQTLPAIYLAMVAAHLLGRFYWLNKDRLDWGL